MSDGGANEGPGSRSPRGQQAEPERLPEAAGAQPAEGFGGGAVEDVTTLDYPRKVTEAV